LKRRPREPCSKSRSFGAVNQLLAPLPAMRSIASVFMHADAADMVLMVLGLLGAIGDGLSTPVTMFISGRVFNDVGSGPNVLDHFSSRINENARNLLYLAAASLLMGFLGERPAHASILFRKDNILIFQQLQHQINAYKYKYYKEKDVPFQIWM
ncbi:hypothetical protein EJB05_12803, partial [Eragrostis curvula]